MRAQYDNKRDTSAFSKPQYDKCFFVFMDCHAWHSHARNDGSKIKLLTMTE
ncbi:hypothetical protein [Helicobacter sp. T3_23-1059]